MTSQPNHRVCNIDKIGLSAPSALSSVPIHVHCTSAVCWVSSSSDINYGQPAGAVGPVGICCTAFCDFPHSDIRVYIHSAPKLPFTKLIQCTPLLVGYIFLFFNLLAQVIFSSGFGIKKFEFRHCEIFLQRPSSSGTKLSILKFS
jgi:hypothetical protein